MPFQSTAKWNIYVLYVVLIPVVSYKIRNVFENLRSGDLCAQNLRITNNQNARFTLSIV